MAVPEDLLSAWPVFLQRLGEKKMSVAAYLAHAKPMHLDGSTLVVGLAGFELHEEVLSTAENRRLINQLLSELAKTAIKVEYTTLPESEEPSESASVAVVRADSPPIVKEIVDIFNATVLDEPSPT